MWGSEASGWWVTEGEVCSFLLLGALREFSRVRSELGREVEKETLHVLHRFAVNPRR